MTFPVLPFGTASAVAPFAVTGKALLPFSEVDGKKHLLNKYPANVEISLDATSDSASVEDFVARLNVGVKRIFVTKAQFAEAVAAGLPSSRFAVCDSENLNMAAAVLSTASEAAYKQVSDGGNRPVFLRAKDLPQAELEVAAKIGYIVVLPAETLSVGAETGRVDIASVFVATLTTDRPDGLFTTLITTPAPTNTALGVVYLSEASIKEAIKTGEGVYQSRKRREELWYKGKTSGATQKVVKIEKDCDSDLVKFVVEPREGYGFCHLSNNFTCFHDGDLTETREFGLGLAKLDVTLALRLKTAPEGLYTQRLFTDESLLTAKLKEELDELLEAPSKEEVAWEAADLLYFVMVYCAKKGVRLADIERNLDVKALKVTRRQGDAKPQYSNGGEAKKSKLSYEMETIVASDMDSPAVRRALTRPVQKTADIMKLVLPIIEKVQAHGDRALVELTAKFDGVALEQPVLRAPFPAELMQISDEMKAAIDLSMANIEKFHRAQLPREEIMSVETAPGVVCLRFAKPIENVGLYVPGGTAVLPSTAMMLGVPAKVAGCRNIVVASPPARATGRLTPEVVYVAHRLGAGAIVMAGGAQAVAAMAYGTESVLKCDKILGPGNQFVTAAKMHIQNDTSALCLIDMPAGPSEVLVVADEHADADFVALDLLSQAEHGVDSQVILVGVRLSNAKVAEIQAAVLRQAAALPRRDIVAQCLRHSCVLLVESYDEAFALSNRYAPEHLILQIDNASSYVPKLIENAGLVFVGALLPELCGDYSSGTNHTLPTYGYARQYSGVNTATFQKFITAQSITEQGLRSIGGAVMTLAAVEGLEAHRYAVQVRMDKLGLS